GETRTDITVYGGLYQWGRNDVGHTFRCDYVPPTAGDGSFLAEHNHYGSDGVNLSAYNPATDTKFVWGNKLVGQDWNNPHVAASTF
ncbi:MAG: hypothetical protein LBG77_06775, partial [Dysgonamonadaceae bacterium]|nr:hypothetical protein [Dysgonamonadaceae bacterium]